MRNRLRKKNNNNFSKFYTLIYYEYTFYDKPRPNILWYDG